MFSVFFTLVFYAASIVVVMGRCSQPSQRLLALGSLPLGWITLCAVAGLLDTLFNVSSTLILAIATLVVTVMAGRSFFWRLPSDLLVRRLARTWWPLVVTILCAIAIGFHAHQLEPWGGWDSMFTWVLRGRFFYLGASDWRLAFSNDLALLHPDYPPLLGWAVHALWRVDGEVTAGATATLFSPLWFGFLIFVLGFQATKDERVQLTMSTAVVLVIPIVWKLAAIKIADFAVTYGILGSCAYYVASLKNSSSGTGDRFARPLAGFLAGWCGLLKNEGLLWCLLFIGVTTAADLWLSREHLRRWRWGLIAGAAPLVATVILFKLTLAPPSDLIDPTRSFEIGEIVQPGIMVRPVSLIVRLDQAEALIYHELICSRLYQILLDGPEWGLSLWWCLFLFIGSIRRFGPGSPLLIAVFLQFCVYYAVYLITPYHPYWHLSTSISRILTHLVPSALCLLAFDSDPRLAGSISTARPAPRSKRKGRQISSLPSRRDHAVPLNDNGRHRWVWYVASVYLLAVSSGCLFLLWHGDWRFGEQPQLHSGDMRAIQFPRIKVASYVSTELGIRDFYATQSDCVPTVLVIDRRESTLLARFPNEIELRRYCDRHHWRLESNHGGLGWARDDGGTGLEQPVKVPRIR